MRRTGQASANAGSLSHPPQIRPAISGSKTFRFNTQANAASEEAISQANLVDLLVMATSASTSALLFNSIRLRKVEMWAAPQQGGAPAHISVTGTVAGPTNRKSDVSMGVTPAHVRWNPSPNSIADLWYEAGASSQSLFTITAGNETIVDVTVDYIVQCDDNAIAGPVPSGATAGVIYGVPLDGIAAAIFVPVDYVVLP